MKDIIKRRKRRIMETNLRQGEAKVRVTGYVSDIALEEKTDEKGKKIIGSITVKTSDTNFVQFNVNVNEKKKDGSENKTFAGIKTVMNEYKSIEKDGVDEADIIHVSGDINPFRSQNTGQEIIGYKSNFFNRLKNREEFVFGADENAEFNIELFVKSIGPEVTSEGEETGRMIVNGWLPTYNGIEPIALIAPSEDGIADAVSSTFEAGQTAEFFGNVVNTRITTTKEIPVAIGKPRIEKKTVYKNELIITGASEAYEEGVSTNPPYNADSIKAAIQERENEIAAQKNNNKAVAPSGKAHNGRTLGF